MNPKRLTSGERCVCLNTGDRGEFYEPRDAAHAFLIEDDYVDVNGNAIKTMVDSDTFLVREGEEHLYTCTYDADDYPVWTYNPDVWDTCHVTRPDWVALEAEGRVRYA